MELSDLGKAARLTVEQDILPQLDKFECEQQLDLIYEWVKTGYISKSVFKFLLAYVHRPISIKMEPLGAEFEKVLNDNMSDLYGS